MTKDFHVPLSFGRNNAQKASFPFIIFLVNMNKCAKNCGMITLAKEIFLFSDRSWDWAKSITEVNSEPAQTSKIEIFVRTVHSFKPFTIFAKASS